LLATDAKLQEQAKNNAIENFKFGFDDLFMDKLFQEWNKIKTS
jgi:type I restriction enzyme R subunit